MKSDLIIKLAIILIFIFIVLTYLYNIFKLATNHPEQNFDITNVYLGIIGIFLYLKIIYDKIR